MLDEPAARLHQPLLKARQRPVLDPLRQHRARGPPGHRFPRLYASTLSQSRTSLDRNRWQLRLVILAHRGERLEDAVCNAFEQGLGVKVRREESFREDMALVDSEGHQIALIEVKGTTGGGVQREQVNQADSHRERAGLPGDFPSLLIINTNINKAASMEDKDQPVAQEQVEHAARNNVLIIRTIDLLFLIERDGSRAA